MPASSLRRWLRRQPQPTRLRVDGRDVAIATGANHWAVTEETLRSLNPSRIEAIGEAGVMLRAMSLDRADADDETATPARSETELTTLARIIADAHDAGARRHAEAYQMAFSENTQLVTILATRLGHLESAWQEAMQAAAQAQADAMAADAEAAAAASGDPAGGAVAAMLAGAMGGGPAAAMMAAAKQQKPNGAKKTAEKGEPKP
jgi:hypothetical protein